MTAVGQTAPGQLDVPFGISAYYFTQFGCGDAIKFYPNDGTPHGLFRLAYVRSVPGQRQYIEEYHRRAALPAPTISCHGPWRHAEFYQRQRGECVSEFD